MLSDGGAAAATGETPNGRVMPDRRSPADPFTIAKPTTTTPTSRIRVGRHALGTTTGSPASASRPGAVPTAKTARVAPASNGEPVERA
jgi:hypothetical protein